MLYSLFFILNIFFVNDERVIELNYTERYINGDHRKLPDPVKILSLRRYFEFSENRIFIRNQVISGNDSINIFDKNGNHINTYSIHGNVVSMSWIDELDNLVVSIFNSDNKEYGVLFLSEDGYMKSKGYSHNNDHRELFFIDVYSMNEKFFAHGWADSVYEVFIQSSNSDFIITRNDDPFLEISFIDGSWTSVYPYLSEFQLMDNRKDILISLPWTDKVEFMNIENRGSSGGIDLNIKNFNHVDYNNEMFDLNKIPKDSILGVFVDNYENFHIFISSNNKMKYLIMDKEFDSKYNTPELPEGNFIGFFENDAIFYRYEDDKHFIEHIPMGVSCE